MQLTLLLKLIPFETERALCSKLNKLMHRRPSSAPFLSGDTYRAMADYRYDETESLKPAEVAPNSLVFVNSYRLEEFSARVLPAIRRPFVLITHQSDLNIGEEFRALAEHPMVLHWFAQNCLLKHPKVTPLPIGLEDRWRHNNGEVGHFRRLVKRRTPSLPRIAYAFTLGSNLDKRVPCYRALHGAKAAVELPQPLNARLYRKMVRDYMFIASPPGNGLDCHRTWEALYMGCVPMVEDNYMNGYFKDLGLPLVLVKSWDEVRDFSEDDLKARYAEVRGGVRSAPLFSEFWEHAFRDAVDVRG